MLVEDNDDHARAVQIMISAVSPLALAPHVPIVVLTALDDERLATDAVKAGAQDYLVKGSFDANVLVRAIRHALARHPLLADLEHARSREANRATDDDLTGLPNRVLFFDRLSHSIDRASRLTPVISGDRID